MMRMTTLLGAIGLMGAGALLARSLGDKRVATSPVEEPTAPPIGDVRDAGADAMQNPPRRWEKHDEALDESFPASDPPGNY